MSKLPFIAALLAVVAIVSGIFVGMQSAQAELSVKAKSTTQYLKENNLTVESGHIDKRLPKAEVVGETEHNFGHIGYLEQIKIEFKIKNTGGSELRVEKKDVSCGKCVWIEIPHENLPEGVKIAPETDAALMVAPGKTASVFVWFSQKNKDYEPEIAQSATFRTSDPRNRIIEFRIAGKITKAYRLIPASFDLSSVSVSTGVESRIGVFGYGPEPLTIEKVEFLSEVSEGEYSTAVEPMASEEVKAEEGATSGFHLVLKAQRPPLGKIDHRLRLHVSNAEPATVDIPVSGSVVGPITVLCLNQNPRMKWNATFNFFDWSTVDGKVGEEVNFRLRAKLKEGDKPLEFKIKEIYPSEFLQAELGEAILTEGAQTIPLKVRIPAGSKPANFRSVSSEAKPARIVIETNDPITREIVIGVRFGIE